MRCLWEKGLGREITTKPGPRRTSSPGYSGASVALSRTFERIGKSLKQELSDSILEKGVFYSKGRGNITHGSIIVWIGPPCWKFGLHLLDIQGWLFGRF